jgi:hypothetical protein
MYLFITAHRMAEAENPVVDRDQLNQVSSVIVLSVSGFTYVKTVKSQSLYVCPSV